MNCWRARGGSAIIVRSRAIRSPIVFLTGIGYFLWIRHFYATFPEQAGDMHLVNDAYYIAVRMQYPHSLEPRGNNHRPDKARHRCSEVHADRAIRLDEPRRVKRPDKGRAC